MPPASVGTLFTPPPKDGNGVKVGIREAARTLVGFYRRHVRLMSADLACRVARSGLQLVIPMVALKVFQVYLPSGDISATGWAALVFAALAVASSAFEWCGTLWGQWLGFRIEAEMRERLFDHIERLPFAYFDRTKTGEILSRITGDLRQVGSTAHLMPEALVEIVLMLAGSFAVMFSLNVSLALWTLLPVPFILLFAASFQKRIHSVWRGNRQDAAAFSAHVENAVQGIREVKSFTCEDREREAFRKVNDRFRLSFERMSSLYAPLNSGTQLMIEGYSLMYIALGAWMVAHGSATFGEVFAFYMYSRYVTMPMMRVVNFLDMFQQGIVGVRRYLEVLKEQPERDSDGFSAAKNAKDAKVEGRIEFRGVRFRYPGTQRDVLDIPGLVIPAGSVCAFVGPSGGGKSTIAALVPRFYDPSEGQILLDGRDTASLPKRALRSAIGMVAQRPFLFDGTIRENLLLGDPGADDARLMEALKGANLADFVGSLPDGLETPVGERGVRLSGGQAQRIAIARVFLKNPPILILDEATSALDTFAEAAVQEALGRLAKGRTTIIIAHRLTTIRHATMICYLENGRIVESGSHDELIALNGRYRALLALANSSSEQRERRWPS
ncbi:MAG: ABC transporter ATP-binding protein [Kiritimatiellae bacterium]|nr:ABC transporter ATP-binding protein [Kiritimatiellia bacterium]